MKPEIKKIIIYAVAGLILICMIRGCVAGRLSKVAKETIPVRVMKVEMGNIKTVLDYVGNIKGCDEALVYPKITGKIVEKVRDEGDAVKKDDPILYVDRDEVGLKFEKAPVESPLDGVVGRIYVDIGSNVTTQTPVALVTNMEKAEISLSIPEKYLPKVFEGEDATIKVDAYPDEDFKGKVTMVSPVVDLTTRAAPIEITIDNADGRLKSGMFAKVKLVVELTRDVPVIMKEAVMGKAPDQYVYVVEGNTARERSVKLGSREAGFYEVKEGLKEGDLVVIMGQQRLFEGAPVKSEE
jgi:multidrug efflux pump subunit AcrA (membrane-fusion protein)